MTSSPLRIDFISDISCPWCAVALCALQQALAEVGPSLPVTLHFQPFELNPDMAPGGQDTTEHLTEKYGSTPEQQAQIRQAIAQRGAEVGFTFAKEGRGRIHNTFDAHRLLHWASTLGGEAALRLKMALLRACHTHRLAMDDAEVLLSAVAEAGLDSTAVRQVLEGHEFAHEVRAMQEMFAHAGIQAVPAVVVNQRHLLSGSQTAEVYARALKDIGSAA